MKDIVVKIGSKFAIFYNVTPANGGQIEMVNRIFSMLFTNHDQEELERVGKVLITREVHI